MAIIADQDSQRRPQLFNSIMALATSSPKGDNCTTEGVRWRGQKARLGLQTLKAAGAQHREEAKPKEFCLVFLPTPLMRPVLGVLPLEWRYSHTSSY